MMIRGVLKGMTLSGIHTQTTAGNGVRKIVNEMIITDIAEIPDDKWNSMHAGDDANSVMARQFVRRYLKVL